MLLMTSMVMLLHANLDILSGVRSTSSKCFEPVSMHHDQCQSESQIVRLHPISTNV